MIKTIKISFLLLAAAAFLSGSVAVAQTGDPSGAKIESNLKPKKATIGAPLYLNIWVTRGPKQWVVLPKKEEIQPPFEARSIQRIKEKKKGSQVEEHLQVIVSTFELGTLTLKPVTVVVQDESGHSENLLTDSFDVQIVTVGRRPTDANDIRPIKKPLSLASWLKWVIGVALGLLGILLGWLLFRWAKKKFRRISQDEKERLLPCHERAFLYLNRLKVKGYLEKGQVKEFHVELSDIVRRYLEERFLFAAMELTTDELKMEMERRGMERLVCDRVHQFMEECDLVKFAKWRPSLEQCERTFGLGWGIVDLTKQEDVSSDDKKEKVKPSTVFSGHPS